MSKKIEDDIREIDVELLKELKTATLTNIKSILGSVKILLDHNENENKKVLYNHSYVCAGLYTYAIEEYGKLLILQNYEPTEGKMHIEYWSKFRKHPEKFRTAIEKLREISPESIEISIPFFDKEYFDPDFFDTEATIAEFQTRISIFYSDFKDNHIVTLPTVNLPILKKAYKSFNQIIESIEL